MKKLALIALLAALFIVGCSDSGADTDIGEDAPPDAVPDITGSYVVNGVDPLGTEYSGFLTVEEAESASAYELQWIVTGSIQEGRGVLEGNQLLVEWETVEGFDAQSVGTAAYTVTVDGVLYGSRSVNDFEQDGYETAYPNEQ